ncbi:ATPase inhibitor subunit zeta [Neorhizobium alkalisoli]|jgi:hypothetical protein|uniref:DUF1476 domain-containing protein n=1 Tax=Neorhizobium alkalisoli TaxID=528178 RepID=A0A561QH38_9HYPH|nr:ATPase inhibitor subunit zeta [Neorhizobium alkalisoli]TWF49680.1 hypothetical protein FHW37_10746 [Neorhizobium alkalisoli]
MASTLRNRATALEDRFAYDQTYSFRAEARRNKLIGLWAASRLGLDDAEGFAVQMVRSSLENKSGSDVATQLRHEFDTAGVALSNDELQSKMHDLLRQALRDLEQA